MSNTRTHIKIDFVKRAAENDGYASYIDVFDDLKEKYGEEYTVVEECFGDLLRAGYLEWCGYPVYGLPDSTKP